MSTYGYDTISRLTGLSIDLAGSTDDLSIGLGYNPAGQITSRSASNDGYAWTGAANIGRGYTSNGLNQYTMSGSISLAYDANGNLTSSGSSAYTYDSENRMTGAVGTTFDYDPSDRLDTFTVSSVTTRFVYDGGNIAAEYDTSGNLLFRYVMGAGADEPLLAINGSGTKKYLSADERGSIVARTDTSGGICTRQQL